MYPFNQLESLLQNPRVIRGIGIFVVIYSIFTLWLFQSDQARFNTDTQTIAALQKELALVTHETKSLRLQLANKQFEDGVTKYRQDRVEASKGEPR